MRRRCPRIIAAFFGEERGAVLVEMTLITPFVLLLSAGVFEFSNILYTRLSLESGVKDAARYMARCSLGWSTCTDNAKNLAVNGAIAGGVARVSGWVTTDVTITSDCSGSPVSANCFATTDPSTGGELYRSGSGYVNVVDVSTSYSYAGSGLWGFLGFGTLDLTATHQERVIGW